MSYFATLPAMRSRQSGAEAAARGRWAHPNRYFSMTGWRIGWAVLPPALASAASAVAQNLFISAPAVSQHAALAALSCDDELQVRAPAARQAAPGGARRRQAVACAEGRGL